MPEPLYLEIEENDNCEYTPLQVFEARDDPVPVRRVKLFEPDRPHGIYEVTGWSSEESGSPCLAMYVPVSDSGQAAVHVVCGGDWGIRLKSTGSEEEWDLDSPNQWGEPYLMLTDKADVFLDTGARP